MLEEGQDHWYPYIFYFQSARGLLELPRSKDDKQLKAIGISVTGVRAGALIARQVLSKKPGKFGCECGHAAPVESKVSAISAICVIKLGMA
jgi:hypothetical protein